MKYSIKKQQYKFLFDSSLTPQNAKRKGYDYIDDVIYNFDNPSEAMKDILEFSSMFHCKLGTPVNKIIFELYFGLYMPYKKSL